MRFHSLAIICLMTASLAACASQEPAKQGKITAMPMAAPVQQDMLSLGREMSDGSVDIYEPGTSSTTISPMATFTPRPSPVGENPNLIVRDPNVTVYSLDADPSALSLPELDRSPAVPAGPARRYAPELTPVPGPQSALPDLQAPLAAQGQYASPFTSQTAYQ